MPIHLYRELRSEAIRILLPFSTEDAQKREANARAAIRLGLKLLHGGDPEFLGVDLYDQPQPGSDNIRRRYLIIQDMVPGGTGLLAELALSKGERLKQAFSLAHDKLRRCSCNQRAPAVRACYQCLFAYREQDNLHLLDRETACSLLEMMLEGFSGLTQAEGGLDGVPLDSLLESELERRLFRRLAKLSECDPAFEVTLLEQERLEIRVAGRQWRVTPQRFIDQALTSAPCRPDLLIEPLGQGHDVLPVAVFADGLEYHVRPNESCARLADDLGKRGELIKSGRFLVWSLSWWDLDESDGAPLVPPWMPSGAVSSNAERLTSKLGSPKAALATSNPLHTLLEYLKRPTDWQKSAACVAFALLHGLGRQVESARAEELLTLVGTSSAPEQAHVVQELLAGNSQPGGGAVASLVAFGESQECLLLLVAQKSALGALSAHPDTVRVVLRLHDRQSQRRGESFRSAWLAWMRAQAFLQFLPGLSLRSDEQIEPPAIEQPCERPPVEARRIARTYSAVSTADAPLLVAADSQNAGKYRGQRVKVQPDFERVLLDLDESLHPLLRAAEARGFSDFAAPYEIVGLNGIEGDVEVAWPDARIGLFFDHQRDMAKRLEREGWRLLPIEGRPTPGQLLSLLEDA